MVGMENEARVVTYTIALWALDKHFDEVGDHLDLSDFELTKILTWLRTAMEEDK
mgnify:CR=1 FL=1